MIRDHRGLSLLLGSIELPICSSQEVSYLGMKNNRGGRNDS